MAEDLACPICLSDYDLQDQQPRLLKCSGAHEVCAECIASLPVTDGTISCPQCRQEVPPTSNPNRGLLAALQANALCKQREATATAAAAEAEAETAAAERKAASAEKKLSRQHRAAQATAVRAAEQTAARIKKEKHAEEARKAAKRAKADRKRGAQGADALKYTFELLLVAAGASVLGYYTQSFLGIWGYNLALSVALVGLSVRAVVGLRISAGWVLAIAVGFHVGATARSRGDTKRLGHLRQMAEDMNSPIGAAKLMDFVMDKRSDRLLLQAAESGDADSAYMLATNMKIAGKKDLEWQYLKMAADAGGKFAQQDVGNRYDHGFPGVPVDATAAARYFKLAADQGSPDAASALGWKYRMGEGVPQDDGEAARYYTLATSGGRLMPNAEYGLSRLLYEGWKGVEPDLKEAFRLCRLALSHGHDLAAHVCGDSANSAFPESWY